PFLEAIRQMRKDVGRDNVLYVHVTLLPHIGATDEVKTKPTQHSVMELRRVGITADVIVCRSDHPISDAIREKVALFADVDVEVDLKWVPAEVLERESPEHWLNDVYGILVPAGFDYRGVEGKIQAANYARVNNVPYFGLCLGMQCATISFARYVMGGSTDANS